jgi:hypothetical protein
MGEKSYEYCFLCDRETGKAGAVDDSIYCQHCYEDGEDGPFCEECWTAHIKGHERSQTKLTTANETLATYVTQNNRLNATVAEQLSQINRLEGANKDVRERINKAESIIKKFNSNVAIGEPSWNAVILPEIEDYQSTYFNGDEVTRVTMATEGT